MYSLEEKVQLKVRISKSLDERFRQIVKEKHGGYRQGLLSFEAETAFNQYIASYRMQQQSTKESLHAEKANPAPKVYHLKQEIYKYLIDSGMYLDVPQFIHDKQLRDAIGHIKGMDHRTVLKWIKLLKTFGCIKESGMHQYEFV
jgi:hypothetical protein